MFSLKNKNILTKLKSENYKRVYIIVATLLVVYFVLMTAVNSGIKSINSSQDKLLERNQTNMISVIKLFSGKSQNTDGVDEAITLYNRVEQFFNALDRAREINFTNPNDYEFAVREFVDRSQNTGFILSNAQYRYLINYYKPADLYEFKNITLNLIGKIIRQRADSDLVKQTVANARLDYSGKFIPDEMKKIGTTMIDTLSKEIVIERDIIPGAFGKIMLYLGVFIILSLIVILFGLYIRNFHKAIVSDPDKLFFICLVMVTTLLITKWISTASYSPLAIPVLFATVLISIFIEPMLGLVANLVLTLIITIMIPADIRFILMNLITGSFASMFVVNANKKNKMPLIGLMMGVINVLVVAPLDVAQKAGVSITTNSMMLDILIAFLNGLVSIVISIGIMPFFETVFKIITPFKLLEILNPNHPLIKRLLVEAPGTYHHSIMVGNLAEAAAESIGANPILARAGAYYHDIGKLNRPDFFMENQMLENPHERLTPNLSTLIITSHTNDGYEIASKHEIPGAVCDIIREHHGTSLVAYFYHKAKTGEKGDLVTEENFRYQGPIPSSVEGAVVMLADCVEAAVRALSDKSEGKIEGLIRKIVKAKLEDGQLAQCHLTLKDLDDISNAFIKVFGGYYHEREEYPKFKPIENKNDRSDKGDLVEDEKGGNKLADTG